MCRVEDVFISRATTEGWNFWFPKFGPDDGAKYYKRIPSCCFLPELLQ